MATTSYMQGRKKYARPQAIIFSENPGITQTLNPGTDNERITHRPEGYEIGASVPEGTDAALVDQFLILSDHNRSPIDGSFNRLKQRERMINGRMRSYHIADKLELSTSWEMLPSRSFPGASNYDAQGSTVYTKTEEYTADNGAGGVELLDWYLKHTDSFWVFLSYDNYKNYNVADSAYDQLNEYSEVVEMFISSFDYSVVKRGNGTYDFWNISSRLEEV